VRSSSLVPDKDPTLLFTNAGMVAVQERLLREQRLPYVRAASAQKCLRISGKHNDLEVVGRDTYHHTLFEMLGNWSFGDYYKPEAIEWAWELLTKEWGLPKDKLYATVYLNDDEAEQLWFKISGLPRERVARFGDKENFWEMGETGPCGPCSEIHLDRGPAACDMSGVAATNVESMAIALATSSCGIWSSSNSTAPKIAACRNCRPNMSTPAWAWNASPRCCKTYCPITTLI
jgi:alanyl-tRNA synthetase